MIEHIIRYIEEKGYRVGVVPGVLLIRKKANGQVFGVDWAISHFDLDPTFFPSLCDEADRRIQLIEEAIAAQRK